MADLGAAYVSDQMRAVTAKVGKPHRLIRVPVEEEYYYIAIASVAGLDAALAESGVSAGCVIGQVLPTATLSDCLRLKDAAEDGWCRGLRFLMLATEEEGEDTSRRARGRTRAILGNEEWAKNIDKSRMDVMNLVAFAVERLRPGQTRLESI